MAMPFARIGKKSHLYPMTHRVNGECSYNREVTHLQQDQPYNQRQTMCYPGLIMLTLLSTVLDVLLLMLRLFHK